MKFTKTKGEETKKSNVSVGNKGKFKSKHVASNGHLLKGTKLAADMLKKGSFVEEVGSLVESNIKGKSGKKGVEKEQEKVKKTRRKGKRQKPGKENTDSDKFSPQVQLGLKLDAMLEEKAKNGVNSSPVASPEGNDGGQMRNDSSTLSDVSPTKNKKRRRGKKNKSTALSDSDQTNSDPVKQSNVKNGTQAQVKKRKSELLDVHAANNKKLRSESAPAENPVNPEKRRKRRGRGKTNSETSASVESKFALNPNDVTNAVEALLKLNKEVDESKNRILDDDEPIFMKFVFFHGHNQNKIMRFNLDHSLYTDMSDICLFTGDEDRKDVTKTISKWEEILKNENCSAIKEIIPLRQLSADHTQFEDKRKLANRFDAFICDGKIVHRVFKLLGGKFLYQHKKALLPVHLSRGNLKAYIDQALMKTVSHYNAGSDCFSVRIGHTGMTERQIQENIISVWKQYPLMFGVLWANIRKTTLFITGIQEMPLFISCLPPPSKLEIINKSIWRKSEDESVVDVLSTAMDKEVTVYRSGKIVVQPGPRDPLTAEEKEAKRLKRKEKKKLKKKAKKMKAGAKDEDDDVDDDDDDDDDLDGRKDMLDSDIDGDVSSDDLEFESDDEEEEMPKGKKQKPAGGDKKNKKVKEEEEESSEESVVDKAEELYLKVLTREMKSKAKKAGNAETGQAQKTETADESDSEHDSSYEEDLGDSEAEMDLSSFNCAEGDEEMESSDSEDEQQNVKSKFGRKQQGGKHQQLGAKQKKSGPQQQQQGGKQQQQGGKQQQPGAKQKKSGPQQQQQGGKQQQHGGKQQKKVGTQQQNGMQQQQGGKQQNQGGKQQQHGGKQQQEMKNAASRKKANQKSQVATTQNQPKENTKRKVAKPGAQKPQQTSPKQRNNDKQAKPKPLATLSPDSPADSSFKKSKNTFQGIKANKINKKKSKSPKGKKKTMGKIN